MPSTTIIVILLLLIIFEIALSDEEIHVKPNEEGVEFLRQNADRSDVTILPSGVQYRVDRKGLGMYHPLKHTLCHMHFEMHTRNGTKLDSSYNRERIVKTRPDHLVKGLEEALQLMVEGDLWEIFVPSELGYSTYHSHSHDDVDHSDVTIFKILLVEIRGEKKEADDRCEIVTLKSCGDKLKSLITSTVKRYKTLDRMKMQLKRVERQLEGGKATKEQKDWLREKAHVLDVLVKHWEGGGNFDEIIANDRPSYAEEL